MQSSNDPAAANNNSNNNSNSVNQPSCSKTSNQGAPSMNYQAPSRAPTKEELEQMNAMKVRKLFKELQSYKIFTLYRYFGRIFLKFFLTL